MRLHRGYEVPYGGLGLIRSQYLQVNKLLLGLIVIWLQAPDGLGEPVEPPVFEVKILDPRC